MSETYHVINSETKHYGTVIGIFEYLKKNKWQKPKRTIGTESNKLTDEQLTAFIEEFKPEEINLLIKDKKGEYHKVDFTVEDFK